MGRIRENKEEERKLEKTRIKKIYKYGKKIKII